MPLSAMEKTLAFPQDIVVMGKQPIFVVEASMRTKTISTAMSTTFPQGGLPLAASLFHPDHSATTIMIISTALHQHPLDTAKVTFNDGNGRNLFPRTHNDKERWLLCYRKYHAGFIQNVRMPMLTQTRRLTVDTKFKDQLPLHFIIDARDLRLGTLNAIEYGKGSSMMFMICPPEHPTLILFLARVGLKFDIDLFSTLHPAKYLILNQFSHTYPMLILEQMKTYERPVITRMVNTYYNAVFVLSGKLHLTIIGYPPLLVPAGVVMVYPARLWVHERNTEMNVAMPVTVTLAF